MPNWTEEQLKAIETRDTNILLSAAAGSGKTTVLVERVLRLIKSGADIDRMLIVTFTRAASADMREKLTEKLTELAAAEPRFHRQLLLLERASISTLHAFCSDFLRSDFESAGIDPSFRLIDNTELADMKERALDEAIREAYTDPDEAMNALNSGRGRTKVREMTALLLDALDEQPEPEAWLEKMTDQGSELISAQIRELRESAYNVISKAIRVTQAALDHPDCSPSYIEPLSFDISNLESIRRIEDFDALQRALSDFKQTSPNRKGLVKLEGIPKSCREYANKLIKAIPITKLSLSPLLEDSKAIVPVLKKLGSIAWNARVSITERKRSMAVLTYNDLEHFTINALKDDATAEQVRSRFDYVFVDEYQDTSNLQEAIVSRITRGNNLFMVGDVKQSIYRFRHAEPALFQNKYKSYGQGNGGNLLHLTRNFRSCPVILSFVNAVFKNCMVGGETEIEYDENAQLNHGNAGLSGGNVELHILKKPDPNQTSEYSDEDQEDADAQTQEGLFCVQRIHEMMDADKSLKFSDFAILSRSGKQELARMAMVLTASGIPAYAASADSYYDSMEVQLAFSLLRLVRNRRSDEELIGVLYSPLVGLTSDELARIRIHSSNKGIAYCDAVRNYISDFSDDLADRLKRFYEQLDSWQILCETGDLGYFTRTLFNQSGLYTIAKVLPAPAQRTANLDRIVNDAEKFDHDISGSLSLFMDQLERRRDNNEVGDVSTLSDSDNVVRLMTIHKSKGLEFRVVFGVQLGKKFNTSDVSASLITDSELGIAFLHTDTELKTRRKTLARLAIERKTARKSSAEELRVLYVMLTRAKEQLILVGSGKDPDKLLNKAYSAANPQNFLDVIMPTALQYENTLCSIRTYDEYFKPLPADAAEKPDYLSLPADSRLIEAIRWRDPDSENAFLPLKLSVSGVLRELHTIAILERLDERPRFMMTAPGKLTGSERGTAYHQVLRYIDLETLRGLSEKTMNEAIADQMDLLLKDNRLSQVQHDAVDAKIITRFLRSDTGSRLLNAEEIHREWSFNARMNIADVLTLEERGRWGNGEIMVQGTVDACFRENNKWVLLDYKTDRLNDREALTARYMDQLRMYAYALKTATGIPVSEIRLCLIFSGETIDIKP